MRNGMWLKDPRVKPEDDKSVIIGLDPIIFLRTVTTTGASRFREG